MLPCVCTRICVDIIVYTYTWITEYSSEKQFVNKTRMWQRSIFSCNIHKIFRLHKENDKKQMESVFYLLSLSSNDIYEHTTYKRNWNFMFSIQYRYTLSIWKIPIEIWNLKNDNICKINTYKYILVCVCVIYSCLLFLSLMIGNNSWRGKNGSPTLSSKINKILKMNYYSLFYRYLQKVTVNLEIACVCGDQFLHIDKDK